MSAKVPRLVEGNSSGMGNWATLQNDIIGIIIKKLAIPDYIRFRAVCTSWNHACRDVSNRPRVDPWLMLPPIQLGAQFFCVPERKNQIIHLPSTVSLFGSLWAPIGSSHGWLIYFSQTHGTMQLVNPISGTQIQLPPIGRRAFSKAMLLEMNERNFIVAVLYGDQKGYKVTRKGSNSWSSVESKHILDDIIKHRGQLYTCDMYGTVELWAEPPRAWPDEEVTHQWRFRCLVETPAGDLIRVKRQSQNKFAVWILDKETFSWVEIDNIEPLALFVSYYNSVCFLAKDHPNLKANCIYFIDTNNNLCAFNLENGTKELVETLAIGLARNDYYRRPLRDQLLWFIPSLK
ncbi:F-box protein At2g05970-like isoform X2 [Phragmites australis]|uniref:F-box protein At2g05970-like isoform X2 n=1 Tax=Phragmites australis TaxID=29695 RepID=UPI002D77C63C|nr:F-box protein At2g05970-like isoform X2 [Phragmites australis]XP_062194819.1 F-box protein At2g05970-like isoform X2 [Phragmites australis]XP_062194820.1 F-box protein At2g05970-like isoform X2 [Phragmites australis]